MKTIIAKTEKPIKKIWFPPKLEKIELSKITLDGLPGSGIDGGTIS